MSRGPYITADERFQIRTRVAAGERPVVVAAALGRPVKTVYRILTREGGVPPQRAMRSPLRLSVAEREEISRALSGGASMRAIARQLGRAPSTISREIAASGDRAGYRAWDAERLAGRRARRPKPTKLVVNRALRLVVEALVELRWSPEQISARLRHDVNIPRVRP